jgi:hypothetical protein
MVWVNGNVPRREPLLSRPIDTGICSDYNDALHRYMRTTEERREEIMEIVNVKKRAIAALLYVDISVTDIGKLLGLSRGKIYRVCRGDAV